MKRLFALAAFLVIAFVIWFAARSQPSGLSIGFAGSTNGVVGPIAPTFSKMTTNHAAANQAWLAAGTNGALFMVTNQHRYAIDIFPVARIYTSKTNALQTPLLNAPTWSGIRLAPGETVDGVPSQRARAEDVIEGAVLHHHDDDVLDPRLARGW